MTTPPAIAPAILESKRPRSASAAGETVAAVFTNVKRGTIVVEKQVEPEGDSTKFQH